MNTETDLGSISNRSDKNFFIEEAEQKYSDINVMNRKK